MAIDLLERGYTGVLPLDAPGLNFALQVLNFALLVLNIARASANEAYNVREWDWFGQDGAAVFATRRVSYLGHARACSTILSSRLNVSDTRVRVPDTDVKVSNTNARACLTCLSLELGARDAPRGRVDLSKATPITEENIHAFSAALVCALRAAERARHID